MTTLNSSRAPGRAASALGLLLLALLATAQSPSRPAWWHAASDHFEAYAAGSEKRARDAIASFERIHPAFAQLFAAPADPARRPRIVVFSSAQEFAPFRSNDVSNAFWLGTPDGDFIVLRSLDEDGMPDVMHEYTHLMMNRAGFDYPLWLSEGMAEFYSTMAIAGAQVKIGGVPSGALDTLTRTPLLPLARLFAVGEQSPEYNEPRVAQLFYAESWAATHMLLSHESYKDRADSLLAAMALGQSTEQALRETYGKSPADVDGDLRKYLARIKLPSSTTPIAAAVYDAGVTSARADAVDVDVTLASLLGWRPGRAEDSRQALEAIARRAPDNVGVLDARALLETYTSNCGAARDYLQRAVEKGTTNAAVREAYAAIVGRNENPGPSSDAANVPCAAR